MAMTAAAIDSRSVKEVFGRLALEIAESAFLGCFEPNPVSRCYDDELPRVRRAILRARDGRLARYTRSNSCAVFWDEGDFSFTLVKTAT